MHSSIAGRWNQLRLLVTSPEQGTYELLRLVILFGRPAIARARETGVVELNDLFHRSGRNMFDACVQSGVAQSLSSLAAPSTRLLRDHA